MGGSFLIGRKAYAYTVADKRIETSYPFLYIPIVWVNAV